MLVAVPGGPAALRLAAIAPRLGVGVISVDEVEQYDGRRLTLVLQPTIKAWPGFARQARINDLLKWCTPGHEAQAAGVTGAATRWTPFKAAVRKVVHALMAAPRRGQRARLRQRRRTGPGPGSRSGAQLVRPGGRLIEQAYRAGRRSSMSSFLDTLTFLTPAQRAALEDAALDEPVAFAHVTVATLQAEPYGLKLGHASRLLAAAGVGGPSGAKPSAVNVTFEAPDQRARIDRALEAAATDPSKAAELADLGVEEVVLDGAGRVDPPKTRAMRVHAASGAHVGPTWQGQRIVKTRSLSTPTIYRCPPTGAPLQDGRAEDTGIPWAELGLDGLRAAGFGYDNNMFRGMVDEAVFEGLKPGAPLRQRVEARILALGVKADALDELVIVRPRQDLAPTPTPAPVRRSPSSLPGSLVTNLSRLLLDLFGESELRTFISYLPHGQTYQAELPGGGVSLSNLAHAAAEMLQRFGAINSDLRERLIFQRPRQVDKIDAVFSAAGIS